MSADQLATFRANLAEIAQSYTLLAEQHHAAVIGKGGPVVGGSREAPVPINVDAVDLTSTGQRGSLYVADLSPWREDQIGHLAIATELDFWVRDISDLLGDPMPVPVVPVLAMWLHERAGWAWDHYGALDEMVVTVARICRALHGMLNPRTPRPTPKAAPCPRCELVALSGDGEWVRCSTVDCGRVLSEVEYAEWSRLFLHRELLGGDGISAREIVLRYQRPIGTVHRYASQYRWARTRDNRRPVLYLRAEVEASMAGILEREAAAKAVAAGLTA